MKLFGLFVLIITAVLSFVLFSTLGLDGISIAAPSYPVLMRLFGLFLPMLIGLWIGFSLSVNMRTATRIVTFLLACLLVSLSIGYLRFH